MKKRLWLLIIFILLFGNIVYPKTADEVFDVISSSVVMIRAYDAKGTNINLGRGVVVDKDLVATNYHVIQDTSKIQVIYKEKQYLATVQYADPDRDICTLNVNDINAPAVIKGNTNSLKVGMRVYAIKAPQSLALAPLSEGIILGVRKVDDGNFLQISNLVLPGSSGGGLFNEEGQLIGITSHRLAIKGLQLYFALPVEWITELPGRQQKYSEITQISQWISESIAFEEKEDWDGFFKHSLRWTEA
jgi:S1-C subfamily serine protease